MAKVIHCDCGFDVRGDSDDELLVAAHAHVADAHPDMVGKIQDSDFLAMAEEI